MILSILGNLVIFILIYLWAIRRGKVAQKLISDWAKENGFLILEGKYLFWSPLLGFSKIQLLYSVVYKEKGEDKESKVILRVGNYWYGLLYSKEVTLVKRL